MNETQNWDKTSFLFYFIYCFRDFDDIDYYFMLLLLRYSSFYVRIHLLWITGLHEE